MKSTKVAVCLGSCPHPIRDPEAIVLGHDLAEAGYHVISGGINGQNGPMDRLGLSVLKAGGTLTAFVSKAYYRQEIKYPIGIKLSRVGNEAIRTVEFMTANALVAMGGSEGTLAETFTALAENKARMREGCSDLIPCILINKDGLADAVKVLLSSLGQEDLEYLKHICTIVDSASQAVPALRAWDINGHSYSVCLSDGHTTCIGIHPT